MPQIARGVVIASTVIAAFVELYLAEAVRRRRTREAGFAGDGLVTHSAAP